MVVKKRAEKNVGIPAVGEGKRGVGGHIGYLLRQANAAVREVLEKEMAEVKVTFPQFLVLTMVGAYPGISGAEVARLAMLTPQTINLIVRNLERARAVEKQPDPEHGRVLKLALTAHGAGLLAECRKRANKVETRMGRGMSAEEEAVVRKWLVQVAAMGAEDQAGAE